VYADREYQDVSYLLNDSDSQCGIQREFEDSVDGTLGYSGDGDSSGGDQHSEGDIDLEALHPLFDDGETDDRNDNGDVLALVSSPSLPTTMLRSKAADMSDETNQEKDVGAEFGEEDGGLESRRTSPSFSDAFFPPTPPSDTSTASSRSHLIKGHAAVAFALVAAATTASSAPETKETAVATATVDLSALSRSHTSESGLISPLPTCCVTECNRSVAIDDFDGTLHKTCETHMKTGLPDVQTAPGDDDYTVIDGDATVSHTTAASDEQECACCVLPKLSSSGNKRVSLQQLMSVGVGDANGQVVLKEQNADDRATKAQMKMDAKPIDGAPTVRFDAQVTRLIPATGRAVKAAIARSDARQAVATAALAARAATTSDETVAPWKEWEASRTVTLRLNGTSLAQANVIDQAANRFIIALVPTVCTADSATGSNRECPRALIAIDQHAADERRLLELLERAVYSEASRPDRRASSTDEVELSSLAGGTSVVGTAALQPPVEICLTPLEAELLLSEPISAALRKWHFDFHIATRHTRARAGIARLDDDSIEIEEPHKVRVTSVPSICGRAVAARELVAYALVLHAHGHVDGTVMAGEGTAAGASDAAARYSRTSRPDGVARLLASKACRSAVMFGDKLERAECVSLLDGLARCALPLQCAHGRPSVAVLVPDLGTLHHVAAVKANAEAAVSSATRVAGITTAAADVHSWRGSSFDHDALDGESANDTDNAQSIDAIEAPRMIPLRFRVRADPRPSTWLRWKNL
jgi:DNA mismatch repair ATPase MutL